MCIIAYAPAGVKIDEQTIKNMFENNSHGAGIMWRPNIRSKVQIRKGFMNVDELIEAWKLVPNRCEKAIHCRIATAGKIGPACCHPFPIRPSVTKMRSTKDQDDIVIMHNGVIGYCNPETKKEEETSDTMIFAAEVVYPLRNILDKPRIQKTLEEASNSRLLIFRRGAKTIRLGKWVEHNGAFYSNTTYSYSSHAAWGKYGYTSGCYDFSYTNFGCETTKNTYLNDLNEQKAFTQDNDTKIPVWAITLDITQEGNTYNKMFKEEAIAFVKDVASDTGIWLYDEPCVIKRWDRRDAIQIKVIGTNARDCEISNNLFGFNVLYSLIDCYITPKTLDKKYGLTINDLCLTEKDLSFFKTKQSTSKSTLSKNFKKILNAIDKNKEKTTVK